MNQRPDESPSTLSAPVSNPLMPGATPKPKNGVPHRRERHTWRLVVGLTGLLGVAWAVAIASRYPNILPG